MDNSEQRKPEKRCRRRNRIKWESTMFCPSEAQADNKLYQLPASTVIASCCLWSSLAASMTSASIEIDSDDSQVLVMNRLKLLSVQLGYLTRADQ